jgi:hypothetical protein
MDFDRLYIQDLLDTATREHFAEQPGSAPGVGEDLDEPTVTTQSLGEEGDDQEGEIPFDELPFTSGPADLDDPTATTQSLGEEGDDPEAELPSDDVPFSAEPGSDEVDDFGDDEFGDDEFGVA